MKVWNRIGRRRIGRLSSLVLALWTGPAVAQELVGKPEEIASAATVSEALPPRPQLVAMRATTSPSIDGDLGDASWTSSPPVAAFTQKFPHEGKAPSEPTELRVLYDDDALYVAFDCTQAGVPVRGRLARRDRDVEADWVQIAIDDGSNTYQFTVNAAGVLGDGVLFNETEYSAEWDGVWDGRARRHARGWSAELRIPLRILRRPSGSRDWGFQARRYISQRQETAEWAFIPRAVAGEVSHYGRLSGIAVVESPNPVELLPYVSGGLDWADMRPGNRGVGDLGYDVTAGLDLRWRIANELTLEAAVNPDFAQVEADELVLNLSTFETFAPEKRPFFVNGMEIFQVPRMELFPSSQTLFYTRRIGSVPDAPVIGDDDPAAGGEVGAAEPSTIYAAAKLNGKPSEGVSAAVVSALIGRNDVAVQGADGVSRERLADPLTLANVARVKVDVGTATLGVLGTGLWRFEPQDEYPRIGGGDGDERQRCPGGATLRPGSRCFHDSYAVGLDGVWRSPGSAYVASGQAIVTSIQGGPPRTMPDGTVIASGDTAASGRLYLAKEGGQWLGSIEVEGIGRRVDYNDLGFLQRQNQLRFIPYLAYRSLAPFWEVAEIQGHAYASARDNLDGQTLLRGYYVGGEVRFKNFWSLAVDLYRYSSRFEDREVGDGTTIQRPSATGLDVILSTDPRRDLSASFTTETLLYSQGKSFTLDGEITYQPLPQLELQLLPQLVMSSGDPRLVEGSREEGSYLFGELQARSVGATFRTSYTFTNRLTLQLYSQLLLVAKHYEDFGTYAIEPGASRPVVRLGDLTPAAAPMTSPDRSETSLNLNAVLRWELLPGSTLFAVYSRFQSPELALDGEEAGLQLGALRRGPAVDAFRLKLSYYWN